MSKLGHTRPLMEPHGGPRAGRTGYPQVQDADGSPRAQGALVLGFQAKPKGKCGAPRALIACGLDDAWRLIRRGRLRFPTLPRQLLMSDKKGCRLSPGFHCSFFVLLHIPFSPQWKAHQICRFSTKSSAQ